MPPLDPARSAVVLSVPLPGSCLIQNSPVNRVPSHGTTAFGSSYAIDLVPVDANGRSAPRSWRSVLATEPPETFLGFGMPVLAPTAGTVVLIHDGEPDHEARRSVVAGLPYLLRQGKRARRGAPGLAGNHVVIAIAPAGPYVLVAHLQRGSVRVQPDDLVGPGDPVGRCGNSGNSTEPHVHLQVSDATDWDRARGIAFAFARRDGSRWLPANGQIIGGEGAAGS